jgi:large subunit ribosomal protein L10
VSVQAIEKKRLEVEELTARMESAKSFVIADYSGLTVEQVTALRRELRANGCEIAVIKNNITKRAAGKLGFSELDDSLKGPNAVAFSNEDSVSAAKVIYDFAKVNKELELKVGVVDGEYMDNEKIQVIATIPTREVLLTMFAAGLLEPVKEFAIGLDLMAQKLENPEA